MHEQHEGIDPRAAATASKVETLQPNLKQTSVVGDLLPQLRHVRSVFTDLDEMNEECRLLPVCDAQASCVDTDLQFAWSCRRSRSWKLHRFQLEHSVLLASLKLCDGTP